MALNQGWYGSTVHLECRKSELLRCNDFHCLHSAQSLAGRNSAESLKGLHSSLEKALLSELQSPQLKHPALEFGIG
jgi:hypothetical protein